MQVMEEHSRRADKGSANGCPLVGTAQAKTPATDPSAAHHRDYTQVWPFAQDTAAHQHRRCAPTRVRGQLGRKG